MAEELLSTVDCDQALGKLLAETLRTEKLTAERDSEIARIQKQYQPRLLKSALTIASLEGEVQAYYEAHRAELEQDGKKSVQLQNGLLGMRAPSHPALEPLNSKWSWAKIETQVRELWQRKFHHPPKPRTLNKVKLKADLTAEQLAECGLKLDTEESFYYELNRLAAPDEVAIDAAA
jgi:hypothetical protein